MKIPLTSIELCAGAGGQAIGLESAGFVHTALVEIDKHACSTLRANRPNWRVLETDLRTLDPGDLVHSDLIAGGVPCPPFSRAGAQLGADDDRDMFPHALRIIHALRPRAVMFENVRGLLDSHFDDYRRGLARSLAAIDLRLDWRLLYASDYGVPQLRPRAVGVALSEEDWRYFYWPSPKKDAPTLGNALFSQMSKNGWRGASEWRLNAQSIAPTLVGGSKKHGGADLGPTRAKRAWRALGVDPVVLGDDAPDVDFVGLPRLTVEMAAILQGFPLEWKFSGRKTAMYRQVGNAFPPPVSQAVGESIKAALERSVPFRDSGAPEAEPLRLGL